MPIKLVTEIERPPSIYGLLTKGTLLEPWLWKTFMDSQYLGKPFNLWKREHGMVERIGRMAHIGVCVGTVNAAVSGYFSNLSRGFHGRAHWNNPTVWKYARNGMLIGLMQSTLFTVTVSSLSILRKQDDDALDWFFGGLSTGIVQLVSSQQKNVIFNKRWNMISLSVIPMMLCLCKYLRLSNEYDDPKGGRYVGRAGGTDLHSWAEMRALYGINPHPYNLEMYLVKEENPEMLFLKPRQNPKWNDKYRTDRDVPDSKLIIHKDDYKLDAVSE